MADSSCVDHSEVRHAASVVPCRYTVAMGTTADIPARAMGNCPKSACVVCSMLSVDVARSLVLCTDCSRALCQFNHRSSRGVPDEALHQRRRQECPELLDIAQFSMIAGEGCSRHRMQAGLVVRETALHTQRTSDTCDATANCCDVRPCALRTHRHLRLLTIARLPGSRRTCRWVACKLQHDVWNVCSST
jgi:hypothetical protein